MPGISTSHPGSAGAAGLTAAIPTTGDRPSLRATVESVLRSAGQAGGGAEVIVVVNGRPDAPALSGLRSPMLRVIQLAEPNVSLARNAAIDAARYDTILFTDDDGTVPLEWCAQLRDGLARPGHAVVAAPVRTVVTGPVTGFLNYQRAFNPSPDDVGHGVMYAVTLNCGVRRDRLPATVRFDPAFRTSQDVDFGHSVRAAGLTIGWLPDATPVQHELSESFETISSRYPKYGSGAARLHRKRGQIAVLMPAFHGVYLAMTGSRYRGYRRFSELTAEPVRDAFTILEHVASSLFFASYLEMAGADLGCELIKADRAALIAALSRITDAALARTRQVPASDWAAPAFDYSRFGTLDVGQDTPEISQIKAALTQYAAPAQALPPAAELAKLSGRPPRGRDITTSGAAPVAWNQAWTAWQEMRGGDGGQLTPDSADQLFRAAGISFGEGSHQVEIMLWRERHSPLEPVAQPA
jgi:glycosyltransferase involved in cell wall biosynthesis